MGRGSHNTRAFCADYRRGYERTILHSLVRLEPIPANSSAVIRGTCVSLNATSIRSMFFSKRGECKVGANAKFTDKL